MKKEIIKFAVLLIVAIGSAPAFSAWWQWSRTASSNATADASINWSEGQSPSSINDSARAMMARLAEFRDDTSGLLSTAGTSTAYTVTTYEGLNATPNDGQLLSVTMHVTNGASPTLAADGGTAFPIQSAAGTAVAASVLVQGTAYSLKFSSSSSAYILRDFYGNPFSVPLGTVLEFTGTSVPNSNFVFANGQCVSRTTYAAYFAIAGTTYGACDGTTTFGVPDRRGRTAAGLDNMGGATNANRLSTSCSSSTLGAGCGEQVHTLSVAEMPQHQHTGTTGTESNDHTHGTQKTTTSATLGGGPTQVVIGVGGSGDSTLGASAQHTHAFTTSLQGGGAAHNVVQPTMMANFIVRIF